MIATQDRYLAEDSYSRNLQKFKKTHRRWTNTQLNGGLIVALGICLIVCDFAGYFGLNWSLLSSIFIIGLAIVIIGLFPLVTATSFINQRRLDNFTYWIAAQFMREMHIKHPMKTLAKNPKYLTAFEEIRKTVARKETRLSNGSLLVQLNEANTYRIASLVLRNEESLEKDQILVSLINVHEILDYDSLATLMDTKTESDFLLKLSTTSKLHEISDSTDSQAQNETETVEEYTQWVNSTVNRESSLEKARQHAPGKGLNRNQSV
jgi:hypothetical protein